MTIADLRRSADVAPVGEAGERSASARGEARTRAIRKASGQRLRWRRGIVSVDGLNARFDEDAMICRGLAVHALPSRGPMLAPRFRVTHVASGRRIPPLFDSRHAAMVWARRLLALGDWTKDAQTVTRRFKRRVRQLQDAAAQSGVAS